MTGKKIKKLLCTMLSIAMVMGFSTVAFAADNGNDNLHYGYLQISNRAEEYGIPSYNFKP